jgi:hypothetical protein
MAAHDARLFAVVTDLGENTRHVQAKSTGTEPPLVNDGTAPANVGSTTSCSREPRDPRLKVLRCAFVAIAL